MSFVKKSDVKDHLSARHRRGIHLTTPASQPDATGFSGEQSDRADQLIGNATEGWLAQPGIAVAAVRPQVIEPEGVPVVSKSAQA